MTSRLGWAAVAAAAGVSAFVGRAAWGLPHAMGASAKALRVAAGASRHAQDGLFVNSDPAAVLNRRVVVKGMARRGRAMGRPAHPVPLVSDPCPDTAAALAVTWYGHSSVLLEIDGHRVLTDPVWGDRVSPSPIIGPRRLHDPPVPLSELPDVEVVLISHDHYDHLDLPSVRVLVERSDALFAVPVGIGAHMRHWGVPDRRVVELDWGGEHRVGELTLYCTPARHFSGRGLVRNTTQWASWVVAGPSRRVYFGGDTGYTGAFAEIGATRGPFDLTLLPIGGYSDLWPELHMTPEEAVRAHGDLAQDAVLVPIHWGTFDLGMHSWSEPVERLWRAADEAGTQVVVPRPGARVPLVATDGIRHEQWWTAPNQERPN